MSRPQGQLRGAAAGIMPLLLAGLLVRVWLATTQSAWIDEAYSLQAMSRLPLEAIGTAARLHDTHPPLYYDLLHVWSALVGFGVFQARLLSVLFGAAAIAVLYLLADSLFDRPTALLASALLAFSPLAVWYSDEVRMYAPAGLFALLAVYLFRRSTQVPGSRWYWWAGYAVCAALAVSFDSSGGYLPLAANLSYLLPLMKRRSARRPWLAGNALAVTLALPTLTVTRFQMSHNVALFGWIAPPTMSSVWSSILDLTCMNGDQAVASLVFLLLAVPAAISVYQDRVRGRFGDECQFLAWITFTPLLAPLVLGSISGHPMFLTRTVQTAVFGMLILFARGLLSLLRRRPAIGLLACVAIGISCLSSLHVAGTYALKEDWRGLDRYLDRGATGAGIIVVDPCWLGPAFSLYWEPYHRRLPVYDCPPIGSASVADRTLGSFDSVWLVSGYHGGGVPDDATMRYLEARYRRGVSKVFTGGLVVRQYLRG